MRRVIRAVAEGRTSVGDVTTLEEEASVDEIRRALRELAEETSAEAARSGSD
jgi:acetyl-CoA synthetase